MDDDRLTNRLFLRDHNINNKNWCLEIKNIFQKLNLLAVYNNNEMCNLRVAQDKMYDLIQREW